MWRKTGGTTPDRAFDTQADPIVAGAVNEIRILAFRAGGRARYQYSITCNKFN
jgi:hypothetical protein